MEKKIKINFENITYSKITYLGQTIQVKSRLTLGEEISLIMEYVKLYFNHSEKGVSPESKFSYFEAETALMGMVYDTCTNIDMSETDFNNNIYADSILWGKVKYQIQNFKDFAYKLNRIVQDIKETQKLELSIGNVLSELMDKLMGMVDKYGDTDPESIQELIEHGKEMAETLKAYNLGDVLTENENKILAGETRELVSKDS